MQDHIISQVTMASCWSIKLYQLVGNLAVHKVTATMKMLYFFGPPCIMTFSRYRGSIQIANALSVIRNIYGKVYKILL